MTTHPIIEKMALAKCTECDSRDALHVFYELFDQSYLVACGTCARTTDSHPSVTLAAEDWQRINAAGSPQRSTDLCE